MFSSRLFDGPEIDRITSQSRSVLSDAMVMKVWFLLDQTFGCACPRPRELLHTNTNITSSVRHMSEWEVGVIYMREAIGQGRDGLSRRPPSQPHSSLYYSHLALCDELFALSVPHRASQHIDTFLLLSSAVPFFSYGGRIMRSVRIIRYSPCQYSIE